MSPAAQHHIRQTFTLLEPRAGIVSLLFYQRLFNLAPGVRSLFTGDIEAQGVKLMAMLKTVIDSLEAPDKLIPALEEMGRRHAGYGVEDSQYDIVGQALLETFADVLGQEFSADARDAWATAYNWIAHCMKTGAAVTRPNLPLP